MKKRVVVSIAAVVGAVVFINVTSDETMNETLVTVVEEIEEVVDDVVNDIKDVIDGIEEAIDEVFEDSIPDPVVDGLRPDFAAFNDVTEKKQAFFDYLSPYVDAENARVAAERKRLLMSAEKYSKESALSSDEKSYLQRLGRLYSYPLTDPLESSWFDEMVLRVDSVPLSLVLIQGAKESGWGTSRFSLEGNNFFGQWCYQQGCGLIPNARASGATHEVAVFASPSEAVSAYFMNINRNNAYKELREIRAELSDELSDTERGTQLAEGLLRYSERGRAYVEEIQAMIRQNKTFFE